MRQGHVQKVTPDIIPGGEESFGALEQAMAIIRRVVGAHRNGLWHRVLSRLASPKATARTATGFGQIANQWFT